MLDQGRQDHDDHGGGHGHDHPITILVNRRDVRLLDDDVTGLQIKTAAEVPTTFKLFDPKGDEVGNDERIHVHEHEKFTAISGQDVS